MDVNPISMQLLVPRSTEVTQISHNLSQAALVKQDADTMREKADAELKQKQVRTKDDAEGGRIQENPDRDGRGGYHGGGRRRQTEEEREEESPRLSADPLRGHRIDISY